MKKVTRRTKIVMLAGYLLVAGLLTAGVVSASLTGGMPVGIETTE